MTTMMMFKERIMIGFCEVGRKVVKALKHRNQLKEITFFEVKELYNLAYEQKAQARNALRQYRRIEARAKAMDNAYRAQLGLIRRAA